MGATSDQREVAMSGRKSSFARNIGFAVTTAALGAFVSLPVLAEPPSHGFHNHPPHPVLPPHTTNHAPTPRVFCRPHASPSQRKPVVLCFSSLPPILYCFRLLPYKTRGRSVCPQMKNGPALRTQVQGGTQLRFLHGDGSCSLRNSLP